MHSPARSRRRKIAATLAAVMAASLLSMGTQALPSAAAENPADIQSYAPEGTVNIAPQANATVSSAQAAWGAKKLADGNPGTPDLNLWVAADTGPEARGWARLDFAAPAPVERIVVFPRGDSMFYGAYFPLEYTVTLLDASGESVWTKQMTHADRLQVVTAPVVIDLDEAVTATALRLDVEKRSPREGYNLQLSEIAVFAAGSETAPEPEGYGNIALGATSSASSSYEMPSDTWSAAMAHDGSLTTGWSTNPLERIQDPATPASLTLRLACAADVSKIVVVPRDKSFPRDFRVQLSDDGKTWTTIGTSTNNPSGQTAPKAFPLEAPTTTGFVRLQVDVRNGPTGIDGYLAQIAEFEVYGVLPACLTQQKPALLMGPGATDASWFTTSGPETPFTVVSADPAVATVDARGAVTAVGVGSTTVTLTRGDRTLTLPVEVSDDISRIGDKFAINVFWPPSIDFVNDEQYDYLAEAGINIVQNNQLETSARSANLEMARLAHERGMQIIVQDSAVGAFPKMTSQQVKDWANSYRNIPGVGGLYLIDEPANALEYAPAFNAIREATPELYPHLNFLVYTYYGGEAANDKAMQDWIDATNGRTYEDHDYLMYDMYPFGQNGTNYADMFTNLNTVRELGLKNEVKTAMYLQSVGIPGHLRRPVPAEIRYEANVAMAYGYKQLSYFSWWTPTGRSEPFTDAIITADGKKTDLYEPVKQLNSEIQALGDTLMGLNAEEVYLSGTAYGQPTVPADFVAQSSGDKDLVLSRMVDRETEDEYLFVVNNSFTAGQTMQLTFDDSISAVREVSRVDGSLGEPIVLDDQVLTRDLTASEGVLYQLVEATEPAIELTAATTVRCVAGNVVLVLQATNTNGFPVDLSVSSTYGAKQINALAPGKSASHAFSTRVRDLPAGEISITARTTIDGKPVTQQIPVPYATATCR